MSRTVSEVLFLGTGNAFSPPGRMHALALIDREILIDSPPTALPQLRIAGVSPSDLNHLLFTHWHADHTFGFPFLLLDRDKMGAINGKKGPLSVHCRPGGYDVLSELCRIGFPGSLDNEIKKDVELEKVLGLKGTPVFVINDEVIFGYVGYDELSSKLNF